MPAEARHPTIALVAIAAIAFMVGYFCSRNSSQVAERVAVQDRDSSESASPKADKGSTFSKKTASTWRMGEAKGPVTTSEHPESRAFFEKIGVTKEDLQRVEEIEKRRAQGEYILQNERPTTKKFLDYDFGEIVTQAAAGRSAEYDQLFARLG